MRIAIVGTEGSLKVPTAHSIAGSTGLPLYYPPVDEMAAKIGIANFDSAGHDLIFKLLDALMRDHSTIMVSAAAKGIFALSSIEMLAFYMMWCSRVSDTEQSRAVIRNCVDFTKHYDKIFLVVLDKDNFGTSGSVLGGHLMHEYAMEYLIRGIMNRFGIKYREIHHKDVESAISEIMSLLV